MAILYAFDDYKNKVAFDANIPVVVPMKLPDGSILFYDRGSSYGDYRLNDSGYPERIGDAVDDGSVSSPNWRYLICDQHDLDNGRKQWGASNTSEGLSALVNRDVGAGLPNTNTMLAKYATNTSYWWKLIKEKRDSTGLDWFMPSLDELNVVYNQRGIITSEGGDAFKTDDPYWSSSESGDSRAYGQSFSDGSESGNTKYASNPCRVLRRI